MEQDKSEIEYCYSSLLDKFSLYVNWPRLTKQNISRKPWVSAALTILLFLLNVSSARFSFRDVESLEILYNSLESEGAI